MYDVFRDKIKPRHTMNNPQPLAKILIMLHPLPRQQAFKLAMTLPGSRTDILRTANVPGPSPVGGSKGGTEGRTVQTLDEFEYQAGHYNMACAHASLGNVGESVSNLRAAFERGFDSYATVGSDPDLASVRGTAEFGRLMEEYDPRTGGINPFGVFGKKK